MQIFLIVSGFEKSQTRKKTKRKTKRKMKAEAATRMKMTTMITMKATRSDPELLLI